MNMTTVLHCNMCGDNVELDDCGVFTRGQTMFLCDECGDYIKNMIKEYER